jgi:hypothetical protein
VLAHTDVDREIRAKDDAKRVQRGPMFGDEWPASATFPNRTVADEEPVELGDLRFTAWDFGTCESESETVWLRRRRLSVRRRPPLQRNARLPCRRAYGRVARRHRPSGGGARRRPHALRRPRRARRTRRARRPAPLPADGARGDRPGRKPPRTAERGRSEPRGAPDGALPAGRSAQLARRGRRLGRRRRARSGHRSRLIVERHGDALTP